MRRKTTMLLVATALTLPAAVGALPAAQADTLAGTLTYCDDAAETYCVNGTVVDFGPGWYLDGTDASEYFETAEGSLADYLDSLVGQDVTLDVEDGGDVCSINDIEYEGCTDAPAWAGGPPVTARDDGGEGVDEGTGDVVEGEAGPDDEASDVAHAVHDVIETHPQSEQCADDADEPDDQALEDSCRDFGLAVATAARQANGSLDDGDSFEPGRGDAEDEIEEDDGSPNGDQASADEQADAAAGRAIAEQAHQRAPDGGEDADGQAERESDEAEDRGPPDSVTTGTPEGAGPPQGAGRP